MTTRQTGVFGLLMGIAITGLGLIEVSGHQLHEFVLGGPPAAAAGIAAIFLGPAEGPSGADGKRSLTLKQKLVYAASVVIGLLVSWVLFGKFLGLKPPS